jgi:hypothetical protein
MDDEAQKQYDLLIYGNHYTDKETGGRIDPRLVQLNVEETKGMTEERLKEIEARAAAIVWPPVWREVEGIIEEDIPDLVAALREAQALLGAFVRAPIFPPTMGDCPYCAAFGPDHESDCPWLLAKQYLEAHPPDAL